MWERQERPNCSRTSGRMGLSDTVKTNVNDAYGPVAEMLEDPGWALCYYHQYLMDKDD
jgi:hypothetical protein